MRQIINGKLYNTETAELLAHDEYWDGQNFHRDFRNTFLYKTKKGNYFLYQWSAWRDEGSYLEPIGPDVAKRAYQRLPVHEVEFQEAFGEPPEEA